LSPYHVWFFFFKAFYWKGVRQTPLLDLLNCNIIDIGVPKLKSQQRNFEKKTLLWKIITVNLSVAGRRQFRVTFRKKHIFVCLFLDDIEFLYFDYPVIFPYLLAALNLMLAVEIWLAEVVNTKRLTAPLPVKVKELEKCQCHC